VLAQAHRAGLMAAFGGPLGVVAQENCRIMTAAPPTTWRPRSPLFPIRPRRWGPKRAGSGSELSPLVVLRVTAH